MWEISSNMLSPLTHITYSKVKFKWTSIEQDAFDKTKHIVARDTLLAYTYFIE